MAQKKNGKVAECVYRRGNSFEVRVRVGGKRVVKSARSKEDAIQIRNTLQARKRIGARADLTISQWRDQWLEEARGGRGEPWEDSTKDHYTSLTRTFAEEFGHRRLDDFTREDAQDYAIDQPVRARAVSAMFGAAFQRMKIDTNPFEKVGTYRTQKRRVKVVLTRKELDSLLATCERVHPDEFGREYAALVATAAWTGIRPGEMFALRWGDIDWERGRIHVRRHKQNKGGRIVDYTKNGDQRTVVLPPPALVRLQRDVRRDGMKDDLVFHTMSRGPLSQRTNHYYWAPCRGRFWERLPKERQALVNPEMDFYELRHFCATYLLSAPPVGLGLPAYVVAAQLGHRDGGALVMSTYAHPGHEDALSAIDEGFRGAFG